MNKDIQQKIRECKALQGKTIEDIISMERFQNNLAAYMQAQRTDREAIRASYKAMRKLGGANGYKLPAHSIDRVINMSVQDFAKEYALVVTGESKRSFAEREYIGQLGAQAYSLTMAQIVSEEFPELKDVLIPSSNGN